MNKITILGCGTSTGVPILGCKCRVCQSTDARNRRLRSSVILETSSGKNILIDTSPDLRTQLLRSHIDRINAAIITHDHADHTHGMDDLRPFGFIQGETLPIFTDGVTAHSLREKFPYIFKRETVFANTPILGGGIPKLELREIKPREEVAILDEPFEFFPLPHGHTDTLAVRHRAMAYVVDCRDIPPDVVQKLRDSRLELLIIDCLRPQPHQTHLHLDLTLKFIHAIAPRTAVLTHMGHEWDYLDLTSRLRDRGVKNVFPAQDAQSFLYSN
jgi:phosphoribosyl 1,2-cyclic phosphate phosphodiesterase